MGSFLLSLRRQENVCWFVDRYTEELALASNPDVRVSFLGHSNGTYLLAKGLSDYGQLRFHNVVFAGSVVPQAFPWNEMIHRGRVSAFRNDRGDRDIVVGIFPGAFEHAADLFHLHGIDWFNEIGSGGFLGFFDDRKLETILAGGHGAAIDPATAQSNYPTLARFLLTGSGGPDPSLIRGGLDPSSRGWAKLNLVVCFGILVSAFIVCKFLSWPTVVFLRARLSPVVAWLCATAMILVFFYQFSALLIAALFVYMFADRFFARWPEPPTAHHWFAGTLAVALLAFAAQCY